MIPSYKAPSVSTSVCVARGARTVKLPARFVQSVSHEAAGERSRTSPPILADGDTIRNDRQMETRSETDKGVTAQAVRTLHQPAAVSMRDIKKVDFMGHQGNLK